MKVILGPTDTKRTFGNIYDVLTMLMCGQILFDTGAGILDGVITMAGFDKLNKLGSVIYSIMIENGKTLRPFTGKTTRIIGKCMVRLTFCAVDHDRVFGDPSARVTDPSTAPTDGALITVDWMFDIVNEGSPQIIIGPTTMAISGINNRNFRKNGETITAGVLEFNTLMNHNPSGEVINYLLNGKAVPGLQIHNKRRCVSAWSAFP